MSDVIGRRRDGTRGPLSAEDLAQREIDAAAHQLVLAGLAATAYRRARKIDYRDRLAKVPGDFIDVLGDMMDLVIRQTEANRQAAGAAAVDGWSEALQTIAEIKAAHPKPD
jgi:hypothetical protein